MSMNEAGSAAFRGGALYAKLAENGREMYCAVLTDAIRALAKKDARLFAEEFPGQPLSGSWDSQAWAVSSGKLAPELQEELEAMNALAGHDLGWTCYAHHLRAEVAAPQNLGRDGL